MPIPPRLHRGEVYHARVPPAALFVLAQNVATFVEAFLAIDALAWPAGAVGVVSKRLVRKNEKSPCPSPCLLLLLEITRAWRNWQTRMVQVHMGATP